MNIKPKTKFKISVFIALFVALANTWLIYWGRIDGADFLRGIGTAAMFWIAYKDYQDLPPKTKHKFKRKFTNKFP